MSTRRSPEAALWNHDCLDALACVVAGVDFLEGAVVSQPTWVFTSRSLPLVGGGDIRFVRGDVRPVHEEMVQAAGGRNVWLVGGGELVGTFHDQGLLDEIIVQVGSVTLGAGKPLLPRAIKPTAAADLRQGDGEGIR